MNSLTKERKTKNKNFAMNNKEFNMLVYSGRDVNIIKESVYKHIGSHTLYVTQLIL